MYSYGENFDFDSNINAIIMDYINVLKRKSPSASIREYVEDTYIEPERNRRAIQKRQNICSQAQQGWLPYRKGCAQEVMECGFEDADRSLSSQAEVLLSVAQEVVLQEDYADSPMYAVEVDEAYVEMLSQKTAQRAMEMPIFSREQDFRCLLLGAELAVGWIMFGRFRPLRGIQG